MSVTTYPGTVTPLRGLGSFAESERDVFYGRDHERKELAALVQKDGFRAGLLYGECGVGKTSLLRAGLVPDLRDAGIIALHCSDNRQPVEAIANAMSYATGTAPMSGETPLNYLANHVSQGDEVFIFLFDDIEKEMAQSEAVAGGVADLFTKVATRAGGRVRFLFACERDQLHEFAALESRTGSLFPPASRYELPRLQPEQAALVLNNALALSGIQAAEDLPPAVAADLGRNQSILPADLQIAALAIRQHGIFNAAGYQAAGGFHELSRTWLEGAAQGSGNKSSALRLMAELANHTRTPVSVRALAARAAVETTFAAPTLGIFRQYGIAHAEQGPGEAPEYRLSHAVLAPMVREATAAARQRARRASELLGAKAAARERLTVLEYFELKRDDIVPASDEEKAVVTRTLFLAKVVAGVLVALPILLIIIAYIRLGGSYYFDTAYGKTGVETVVLRKGKPSWFDWLPASPGYGSIVADTGLSESMVTSSFWKQASMLELDGDLDSDYASRALKHSQPRLRTLRQYATTRNEELISELRREFEGELDLLLLKLRPIATGSAAEKELVQEALGSKSAAAQAQALALAVQKEARSSGSYKEVLVHALTSNRPDKRRLAITTVNALDRHSAALLFQEASALEIPDDARADLAAQLGSGLESSSDGAIAILGSSDISPAAFATAMTALRRSIASGDAESAIEAASLVASEGVAPVVRVEAMALLRKYAPQAAYDSIKRAAKSAMSSPEESVRAAAVPLISRVDPLPSVATLGAMSDRLGELPQAMQVALALGWGEVARSDPSHQSAVQVELGKLLNNPSREVRAAAARAYGYTGAGAQGELIDMVKKEYIDVAEQAAYGLANSAAVGASAGRAASGLREMWKKKGRQRRIATEVFAEMALKDARASFPYLTQAVRATDDVALHPIAMRGICNAHQAGYGRAGSQLASASTSSQVEVRRIAIECVADHPKDVVTALDVALALSSDPSGDIRAEAAKVLAAHVNTAELHKTIVPPLSRLAKDDVRAVRVAASEALGMLPQSAVGEGARQSMIQAAGKADASELQTLLDAAGNLKISEILQIGLGHPDTTTRVAALKASLAGGVDTSSTLKAALADADPTLRRAALEGLASQKDLPKNVVSEALALAVQDTDPAIAGYAKEVQARLGDPETVRVALQADLMSRSELIRTRAAAAAMGLASHSPNVAEELLTPLLTDTSHDVRVALLQPLSTVKAGLYSAEELVTALRKAEQRPNLRLVLIAALAEKAVTEGKEAVVAALRQATKDAAPLARMDAELGLGLIEGGSDALGFVQELVP